MRIYWHRLKQLLKQFWHQQATSSAFEIVDILSPADQSDQTIVLKRQGTPFMMVRPLRVLILDDDLIQLLSPVAVRTLTYLAVRAEQVPDCAVISQALGQSADDFQLAIAHRHGFQQTLSATQISQNPHLISKFDAHDAHKIGYLSGIMQTAQEFQPKKGSIAQHDEDIS